MTATVSLNYIRKSLVRLDSDQISPAKQRDALIHLSAMRGWEAEWYEDAEGHRSGRSEKGRPGWQTLRKQLGRPDVAAVAAYSLARLCRNIRLFLDFMDECEKYDVTIATIKDSVDTHNAMGRFLVNILMSFYQYEAEIASDRMTDSIAFIRQKQGRHWGMIPFGCERDDDMNLIPSEEAAYMLADGSWWIPQEEQDLPQGLISRPYHTALAICYELYAGNKRSMDKVAQELNTKGWAFRDRNGNSRYWTCDDVRRVLHAWPIYAGNITVGRAKDGIDEIIEGSHDPILDLELIDQVRTVLERRGGKRGKGASGSSVGQLYDYLLGGLLFCAFCGAPMQGNWQRGRATYRHRVKCKFKGQFAAQILEDQALAAARQILKFDDGLRVAILDYATDRLTGSNDRVAELRTQLHHHDMRIQNLIDLRVEGEMDKQQYYVYKNRIEAERKEVQARLEKIMATEELHRIETALSQTDNLIDLLGANRARQRLAFELLFDRIEQREGIIKVENITLRPWARRLFPPVGAVVC